MVNLKREESNKNIDKEEKKSCVANWIFKIVVAGAGGVGKTTLIQRYVTGTFI